MVEHEIERFPVAPLELSLAAREDSFELLRLLNLSAKLNRGGPIIPEAGAFVNTRQLRSFF